MLGHKKIDTGRKIHPILYALGILVFWYALSIALVLMGIAAIPATLITDLVTIVVAYFIIKRLPFPSFLRPSPHRPIYKSGSGLVVTCIVLFVLVWMFGQLAATYVESAGIDPAFEAYQLEFSTADIFISIPLALLVAPVCEELMMRGIVYGSMRTKFGIIPAFIVTGLAFALIHGTLTHIVPVFVMSLLLCCILEATGNLWFCILTHVIYNFAPLLLQGVPIAWPISSLPVVIIMNVGLVVGLIVWGQNLGKRRNALLQSEPIIEREEEHTTVKPGPIEEIEHTPVRPGSIEEEGEHDRESSDI